MLYDLAILLDVLLGHAVEWQRQRDRHHMDRRLLDLLADPEGVEINPSLKIHAPSWSVGERPVAPVLEEDDDEEDDDDKHRRR